jgi:hypothetical protein
MEEQKEDPLF